MICSYCFTLTSKQIIRIILVGNKINNKIIYIYFASTIYELRWTVVYTILNKTKYPRISSYFHITSKKQSTIIASQFSSQNSITLLCNCMQMNVVCCCWINGIKWWRTVHRIECRTCLFNVDENIYASKDYILYVDSTCSAWFNPHRLLFRNLLNIKTSDTFDVLFSWPLDR